MTAKLIDVIIISLIVTVMMTLISLVVGLLNTDDLGSNIFSMMYYVVLFALQTFSQLTIAFLVGFLVRKAFISLGIFIFYYIILEPIAAKVIDRYLFSLGRFLPLEISNKMIPVPAFIGKFGAEAYQNALDHVPVHIGLTLVLTTLLWMLCYRINDKRDL